MEKRAAKKGKNLVQTKDNFLLHYFALLSVCLWIRLTLYNVYLFTPHMTHKKD